MPNHRICINSWTIAAMATGLFILGAQAAMASKSSQNQGEPVNGLRLMLSTHKEASGKEISAIFEMQNVGNKDIAVNLGYMFPNGDKFPDAVKLILTDSKGNEKVYELMGVGGVGGTRPTDYLVPLRKGALFRFEKTLGNYLRAVDENQADYEFLQRSRNGAFRLKAEFMGKVANRSVQAPVRILGTADKSEASTYPVWTGKVQSNEVTVEF